MKINKLNRTIVVVLFSFLMLLSMSLSGNAATEISTTDPAIKSVDLVFNGYIPVSLGVSAVYNATIPTIGLQTVGFAEEDQAPDHFQTDGITRTFSDSFATSISTPSSARGIFQTLKTIAESEFSQHTVDKAVSVHTYSPLEPFYNTINDTMNALDPAFTAANFTVGDMYALIAFDKGVIDALFEAFKAKSLYGDIAETYSTNTQMITTLLDDVFGENLFDIIYAPVNTSTYATDWTIAEEVHAVMGGNATDTSINGTTKIVSMRNAIIGYLGERIVSDTVVGQEAIMPFPESDSDVIFGFSQTATTYTLKFRIMGDFINSPLSEDMELLLATLQPADIDTLNQGIDLHWRNLLLFSALGGVGLAAIGVGIFWKTKYKAVAGLAGFIVGFLITLVILALTTATITVV